MDDVTYDLVPLERMRHPRSVAPAAPAMPSGTGAPAVEVEPAALDREPAPGRQRHVLLTPRFWLAFVTRLLVVAFVLAVGYRAYLDGMDLRDQSWRYTRTVRFDADIGAGYQWGCAVLNDAARIHHLRPGPDGHVDYSWRDVADGIVHFYDARVEQSPPGQYELDYTPLRLAVMTLWAWHTHETYPQLNGFPDHPVPTVARTIDPKTGRPTGPGRRARVTEDIAAPLLLLNAYCGAAAAAIAFALVYYWVRREARTPIRADVAPSAAAAATGRAAAQPLAWRIAGAFRPAPIHDPALANRRRFAALFPPGLLCAAVGIAVFARVLPAAMEPAVYPGGAAWMGIGLVFLAAVYSVRLLPPHHRAWAAGLLAALLVWFDPTVLMDAHVWPQWDVWILPAFLLAVLLASTGWWMTAGAVVAAGAMFKGQILLVGPIFLLWPIFAGRPGAAARFAGGLLLGAGLILWPWLIGRSRLGGTVAVPWVENVCCAALLAGALSILARGWRVRRGGGPPVLRSFGAIVGEERRFDRWIRPAVFIAMIAVAMILGWVLTHALAPPARDRGLVPLTDAKTGQTSWVLTSRTLYLALLVLVVVPPFVLRRRSMAFWLAIVVAVAIWSAALLFRGDFSWLTVGFAYGTVKQDKTLQGLGSNFCLPAILFHRYGMNLHDPALTLRVGGWARAFELKELLACVFGVCLVMCGWAAAAHARRNDPKLLAAMVAPWLIFPVVMCQTNERYLIWPAAASAMLVAVSSGLTLLHVLLTVLAAGMIGHQVLARNPGRSREIFDFFTRLYPDAAWMMLLIAAIVFYVAIAPRRRPRPDEG